MQVPCVLLRARLCCTVCHWLRKSRVCLTRALAAGVAPKSSTRPCCGCNCSQWRVITPHNADANVQEDLQSREQEKPVCSPCIRFHLPLRLRVMRTSFICMLRICCTCPSYLHPSDSAHSLVLSIARPLRRHLLPLLHELYGRHGLSCLLSS
jgi:hypothetical protein